MLVVNFSCFAISKNLKKDSPTAIISIPSSIGNLLYVSLYARWIINSAESPSTRIDLSHNKNL